MKLTKIYLVLGLFLLAFYSSNSLGIGFYLPYNIGSASNQIYDVSSWNTAYSAYGFGFVLDTKLAEDKLLNYRLNVGYTNAPNDVDIVFNPFINTSGEVFPYQYKLNRITFDNTFGFGVFRSKLIRLWVGPQVRLGVGFGSGDDGYKAKFSTVFGEIGGGIATGINFNFGSLISLCLDLGFRYQEKLGSASYDYYTNQYYNVTENKTKFYYGGEDEFFTNLSLMFRFDDIFQRAEKHNRRSE